MGQLQKVSWRTVGYAALGTVVAAASVVALINSDGVRPTSLTSSTASRWLVDQTTQRVVLVDGLAGRVVARIATESKATDEVAVQGAGGAFLVAPAQASVRTISTAKLQLGTPQAVALLAERNAQFGVGASGLTILSPTTNEASVVAVGDVSRSVKVNVPKSVYSYVANDGSMWLLTQNAATHVNTDETSTTVPLRAKPSNTITIGSKAVSLDNNNRMVRWLDGRDVSIQSIDNATEAIIQESSDDASCVWVGAGDELACVGRSGIDRRVTIDGLHLASGDKLAVAGSAAAVVRAGTNEILRIDLENGRMADDPTTASVPSDAQLKITSAGDLIWIDDTAGGHAWVIYRFGVNTITKNDNSSPLLDAQGQVTNEGQGGGGPGNGPGNAAGSDDISHLDDNGREDKPVAVDDSVTARAGTTIVVPVTGNDYDPDPGDVIAVVSVGDVKNATHGTTDVLNGTSVAYVPEPGFSGRDTFSYTIADTSGEQATATVHVEFFPPGTPNKAPIARPDKATTRLGRPVTIDVLANDIDPERDTLTISAFGQDTDKAGTITETTSPGSDLQALRYTPPSDVPGNYEFTYQAADPQGGTSQKALVKVTVLADTTPNSPPIANPDALRLRLGVPDTIDVKANDTDPDGDPLTISTKTAPTGVDVVVVGQQLQIKLQPGALKYSVVQYTLSDGMGPTHDQTGKVLVVRIGDSAENRPPVANPDTERVVVGNSVMIPVTANDIDPDNDNIVLLSVDKPVGGVGTTAVSGNSVRFTPNLPDITEPTPVSFGYKITDGRGHDVNGKVTVTVLVQALPRAPFARDDFADTVVGKPVNIDVRANDSDPSGGKPDLLGDPRCNNGGQATTTADQRVTFTPPPDPGTYRCRYTVVNTQGLKAEASIIVAVTAALPGNHAPVIIGSATQRDVNVGGTITFRAGEIANDDDGNPLVFSSVAITQPTHGTTDFSSASPTFTYTAPKVGSPDRVAAVDKVPVVISDGQGGNVPTVISIKINDITPLPTAGPVVHEILRTAASGAPVAIDVLADLLPDNNGATLTLAPASVESGPGTVTTGNGIVSVVTTGPGVVVIGYTVTNASGTPASSKIRVTVLPPVPNDPPVANDDALTVSSGGSGSVDLLANDTGFSDLGDKVTIVLNNRPPAAFGTVTITGSVLTFVAGSDPPGIATLRYTLTDGSGASDDATITLTVLACSESSPSAVPANLFTPYLTPINIDLNSYVVSGHIRAGSVVGAGLKGPTGTYTPPAGMNGNETVTYVVENGCHQTAQGTVTIDVNHSPVGGNISRILDRGNAPLTLTVTELAGDDEPLTITALTGNPAWVTRTSDTTIVAAAPGGTPSGTYTFTATVQDLGGLTATATINLSISNLAPSAIDDAYSTEVTDAVYAIPDPTINDTDPEGGVLAIQTASVISGPATIQTITGKSIAVLLGHGVSTLSYTIVDDGGLTATATITITSNRPPTVPNASGATNGQPTLHVDLDPTEPDGDQLIVSCDAGPNFGIDAITPEPNSGPGSADPTHPKFDLTIRVLHDFTPPATFPCTVTDTFGRSATATVSISVIGN